MHRRVIGLKRSQKYRILCQVTVPGRWWFLEGDFDVEWCWLARVVNRECCSMSSINIGHWKEDSYSPYKHDMDISSTVRSHFSPRSQITMLPPYTTACHEPGWEWYGLCSPTWSQHPALWNLTPSLLSSLLIKIHFCYYYYYYYLLLCLESATPHFNCP